MASNICSTILLRNGLLATHRGEDDPLSTPSARRVDVLIQGDRIVDVAKPNSVKLPQHYFVVDCSDKWIAPGFVDTHRHLWMTIVNSHEDWTLSEYLAKLSCTTAALVTAEDGRVSDDRAAQSVNLAHCRDPFKGIVFHATAADVDWVIVNGEIVKAEGRLVRVGW
ncbi:hypothetical protein GLOTRDRAFT_133013 [Gloeophyllum trabeum ATCC 11539]|uniref:Metallo-dependent hydrolase n=1 Tax=Gloeophyllum trabeum (strain ATCC 11539 / FP-39264 / Madison 617) TaxID=670483 RepID=S7PVH9_GLOTA|nr:uncharacterized protein GLOTRDRAFT_133013 [Gloeophyllum trabeum ATCC 11539]EPQ51641.1 hypothetical protein GLOTRDRAFT_133013 [Gloeophyllum trabeum ATCC 11539]